MAGSGIIGLFLMFFGLPFLLCYYIIYPILSLVFFGTFGLIPEDATVGQVILLGVLTICCIIFAAFSIANYNDD